MTANIPSKTSRTIVVGDVHGCIDELKLLLKEAQFEAGKDRLIFVGDLINKGPDSLAVLDYAMELSAEMTLGNHEMGFLKFVRGDGSPKTAYGKLLTEMKGKKNKYLDWLETIPLYIEDKDFIVVHAGVVPQMSLKDTPAYILTQIRTWDGKGVDLNGPTDPAWFELYTGKKLIIFGHWAKRGLVVRENAIGLDTGCCYGKQLSAVILPERRIVQVKALKAYKPLDD